MGKTQQRVLLSRLTVLLAHLMKWQRQPELRSRSWKNTITIQRIDLQELLQDNPSLQPQTGEALNRAYRKAKLLAAGDTNMDETSFPETCPYSFEQAMEEALAGMKCPPRGGLNPPLVFIATSCECSQKYTDDSSKQT